jgi:ketosteroid isomerase-like protein/uncharacterized protein YciI
LHYLLFYDVVSDYETRRVPFRPAHLQYARDAAARGDLLLAGALADPVDGAVLLFTGASPRVAETFAEHDPYVLNGLVTRWRVRPWTTVVGATAAVTLESDLREIREIDRGLTDAESAGDASYFDRALADDAIIMAPYEPTYVGHDACMNFIRETLPRLAAEFDRRMTSELDEIRVVGDTALSRGHWAQVLKPRDGRAEICESGKYVIIYSRAGDGSWKVARIIFNVREGESDQDVQEHQDAGQLRAAGD